MSRVGVKLGMRVEFCWVMALKAQLGGWRSVRMCGFVDRKLRSVDAILS